MFIRTLIAFAVGVVAMFILDPQQGRRRRAYVRDKMVRYSKRGSRRIASKARDLRNRAKGLVHEVMVEARPEA